MGSGSDRGRGADRGLIVVISAPSGAGKTTVCRTLVERRPSLKYSVSVTTREPRRGENEGRDYIFISDEEFERRRGRGEFLEHASVHGHSYGTPRGFVVSESSAGRDVILDVDVQGAVAVKRVFPDTILILLVPPSRTELERRLRRRQTDTEAEVRRRLDLADRELGRYNDYDYVVVNRRVEGAVDEVEAIMCAERRRSVRMSRVVDGVLHGKPSVRGARKGSS